MSPVANAVEFARREAIAVRIARLHAASWKSAYRGIYPQAYLDSEIGGERLRAVWRLIKRP